MSLFIVVASVLSITKGGETATNRDVCDFALGMESGKITNGDLSASSSYARTLGPEHGRVRVENGSGAWCPRFPIRPGVREWLQVDLRFNHAITGIETQGRFGNGQGQEFTEAFTLEYWRDSTARWMLYKNSNGDHILPGNSNPWLAVRQRLDPPLVAKKLRILPYSNHSRTSCLRVELYGCEELDGILSYSIPLPPTFPGIPFNLSDSSYDGKTDGMRLVGGLGKLTDKVTGTEEENTEESERAFSPFIGWKKSKTQAEGQVDLDFQFDSTKTFRSVSIYAMNSSRFVQSELPSRLIIHLILDDVTMARSTLYVDTMNWSLNHGVATAEIDLEGRIGSNLTMEIYFRGESLLISEVDFETDDIGEEREIARDDTPLHTTLHITPRTMSPILDLSSQEISPHGQKTLIVLISGLFATGILLCAGLTVIFVRKCYTNNTKFSSPSIYPPNSEKKLTIS